MFVDPLGVDQLYGRIAIATAALTHALFATFIVGSSFAGAVVQTIGHLRGHRSFERLARLIAFTLIFSTAAVSFFGVILVFSLNIFWPHFWSTLFRIMFWPLLLEAGFFLGEAVFAYSWYYTWDLPGLQGRQRRWHLALGWGAAACSYIAMFMIDAVASFMLTPQAPEPLWHAILNPTVGSLHVHRIFGNLAWTGLALAAICAVGWLRAQTPTDGAFYRWAATVCFWGGFAALLVMPAIGYHYLLNVRYNQPQAFHTLMLGARSWLFDLVALLYSLLLVLGSVYIWSIVRRGAPDQSPSRVIVPWSLGFMTIAGIVFAMPYHIQHVPFARTVTDVAVNPWGKMQPYKYYAMAVLVSFGLTNWVVLSRSFSGRWSAWRSSAEALRDRLNPRLLIGLSLCAVLTMLSMGWARESSRAYNGYLIYGVMKLSDERSAYETLNEAGSSRDEREPR